MADIYFWRQLFVLTASLLTSACVGFMLAFPSVLNPAITSPNSTDITTTANHASWITAINGVGGLVGSFILSPMLQFWGRKSVQYVMNICLLTGFLIFPFAKNVTALYAARFIQGMSAGGVYIDVLIISEYAHPRRRGYFITLKKVATALGVLACHVMSAAWTWRQISIFSTVPAILAIIIVFFWPESPSHLALKGKFAECQKSFEWLHGKSDESQKQMKALIDAQQKKIKKNRAMNTSAELLKTFLKKDFQKPFLITSVLTLAVDVCGRYYYTAYIIQIMTELMGNNSSAIYFTLSADILTLLAVSTSSVVIRYAKRRTILFTSGAATVFFMLAISLMVFLKSMYTFPTPVLWLTALLIILQSFIANIGLVPVTFAVIGEIFPLEHKGLGSFTSSFVFTTLYAIVLKITPLLMEHTKLYGTYGIFGLVLALCLLVLYRIVPETKDKTLQQIEDELNDVPDREMVVLEREKLME